MTYEVVITAPNPDLKLKPGLTANVTICTLEEKDVLAVPTKALRFNPDSEMLDGIGITVDGTADGAGKTVWVKNGNSISPRAVVTDHTSGDKTGIASGLNDGDVVVTGLTERPRKRPPPPKGVRSLRARGKTKRSRT